MNMRDLTEQEMELIIQTREIWNNFLELPQIHPDHNQEFRYAVHNLQRIIMCRPVGEYLRSVDN